jgi:hypothetical protein
MFGYPRPFGSGQAIAGFLVECLDRNRKELIMAANVEKPKCGGSYVAMVDMGLYRCLAVL